MKSSIHELASNLGRRKLKGLMRASNTNCLQNAERDLHNLFRDEGLCLPIRPVQLDLRGQSVAYMKLTTWFDFLLTKQPQLLFGGYGRDKCDLLLSTFWKLFEQTCPAHDVFQMHGREGGGRLSKCVPYYLHLDEGVSFKKYGIMVCQCQTPFGQETAERFQQSEPPGGSRSQEDLEARMADAQFPNSRGSTFLTRYLLSALPKKMYAGKMDHVLESFLGVLADEAAELMEKGLVIGREKETWYPCFMGVKGDQPALIRVGHLNRSFRNLAKDKGMCWECLAGFDGIPFEDTSSSAHWRSTIGLVQPWSESTASPFLKVPHNREASHEIWRRDPFHAYKQSLGGHFAASAIVLFAYDFKLWRQPGASVEASYTLKTAFDDFRYFIRHEWRLSTNHIMHFT